MMNTRTMGWRWWGVALAALLMMGCMTARAPRTHELFDPPEGRRMRASSSDLKWQNGNADARPIRPGQTLTLAELDGPGVIRHIWFTIAAQDPAYSRLLTLRITWDGESEPAVESPIGDFFAVGHGERRDVISEPVAVSSEGRAYNCYWPMPFRKKARLTVTNDSPRPVGAFYYYIDWEKMDRLPSDTPYFHAQYRQEFPCQAGDYLILDAEGKGHYVGTVLSVRHRKPGWFGEGDDRFYIDGATTPTLHGTGTEDYFSDAWGFRELCRPYYGISLWEGDEYGSRGTAYRWHVKDPVRFDKSLRVTIEHKGPIWREDEKRFNPGYGERSDEFTSVAFWYQTGKAKRFASVPPGPARLPQARRVELEDHVSLSDLPAGSNLQRGGSWSGRGQILVQAKKPGMEFTVPFEVEKGGQYLVELKATRSRDYGIYDILLDGQPVLKAVDLYAKPVTPDTLRMGVRQLATGRHTLIFKNVGTNPAAKLDGSGAPGYYLGLDALLLWDL